MPRTHTRRRRKQRTADGSIDENAGFLTWIRETVGTAINEKPDVRCQCPNTGTSRPCKEAPLPGSLFCRKHQGCPGSPQSGYEPEFDPQRYNGNPFIYKSHNCYSYSMNVIDQAVMRLCKKRGASCRRFFHQPGALNGDRFSLDREERRTCRVVEALQKADNPDIDRSSFYERCPAGKSKIALVVDPGEDYHYYRQDADGMWSHKDGSNKVKRFDALKRPIFNPELAERDYRWQDSDLNYEDFCGFYCVPRDHEVRLGRGGAAHVATRQSRRLSRRLATRSSRRSQQLATRRQRKSRRSRR